MTTYLILPDHHEDGEYFAKIDIDCIIRKGDIMVVEKGKRHIVDYQTITLGMNHKGEPYGGSAYCQYIYLKEDRGYH